MVLTYFGKYFRPYPMVSIVVDDFGTQIQIGDGFAQSVIGGIFVVSDETSSHAMRELSDE